VLKSRVYGVGFYVDMDDDLLCDNVMVPRVRFLSARECYIRANY